jgi:glycopeptide antibiotics resistance protein
VASQYIVYLSVDMETREASIHDARSVEDGRYGVRMIRPLPRRTAVAGVIYLVVLGLIVFWPWHVDGGHGRAFWPLMKLLNLFGVPDWRSYEWLEFGSNVLLFVPLGVLIALSMRTNAVWAAPVIGFVLSAGVEFIQFIALPGRTADVTDVVANTIGASLGAAVVGAVAGTTAVARRLHSR